jgi:hypothetical protein
MTTHGTNRKTKNRAVRATTAVLAGAGVLYGLIRAVRSRNTAPQSERERDNNLEYPERRAHVYFCTPHDALSAARQAVASLPDCRIVHEDIAALTVAGPIPDRGEQGDEIVVTALQLGPRHTRVVVQARTRRTPEVYGRIDAIQSAMDLLLVGG